MAKGKKTLKSKKKEAKLDNNIRKKREGRIEIPFSAFLCSLYTVYPCASGTQGPPKDSSWLETSSFEKPTLSLLFLHFIVLYLFFPIPWPLLRLVFSMSNHHSSLFILLHRLLGLGPHRRAWLIVGPAGGWILRVLFFSSFLLIFFIGSPLSLLFRFICGGRLSGHQDLFGRNYRSCSIGFPRLSFTSRLLIHKASIVFSTWKNLNHFQIKTNDHWRNTVIYIYKNTKEAA